MRAFRFETPQRSTALRQQPVGIGLYVVDEAVQGVVPPTEWVHAEFHEWLRAFVQRMHERFIRYLPADQIEAIEDISERRIAELHSFYLDAKVAFRRDRYVPDPDLNAVTYLRRAYGIGAVRDVCKIVKEVTLTDPAESVCYTIGGTIRYLEAIW